MDTGPIDFPGPWKGWHSAWAKPDNRAIHEWARRYVILPNSYAIPGPFDPSLTRWMIEPFAAVQDDSVREVTLRKSIQNGGTLWAQVCMMWALVNRPGPMMWSMQTDDDAKEEMNTRFNSLMDLCKPLSSIMPNPRDRTKRTTTDIYFGSFFFLANGANLSNLQSKSIQWKINSELWMRQWQGLMVHARGRVTAFEHAGVSKVINESQAGAPDDEIDQAFSEGHQAWWSADCGGGHHPLTYQHKADDGSRSGVVWAKDCKRDDGTWDIARACDTVRYICPKSGKEMPDTDETRSKWNKTGKYIAMRPDAPRTNKSFHVNALTSRPLAMLVRQHLEALTVLERTGDDSRLREFKQKRLAEPYSPANQGPIEVSGTRHGYTYADYHNGELWDRESYRTMQIDRQLNHFWVEVAAIADNGDSRQLYFGRVETVEQAREIQLRLNVPSEQVCEDANYDTPAVYSDCSRFGWRALHGERRGTWPHQVRAAERATGVKTVHRFYSAPQHQDHNGTRIYRFHFSGEDFKNVLATLIQSEKWQLPDDVGEEYLKHITAEEHREVRPGVWKWERIRKDNHGWDTGVMRVAVMTMKGTIAEVLPES